MAVAPASEERLQSRTEPSPPPVASISSGGGSGGLLSPAVTKEPLVRLGQQGGLLSMGSFVAAGDARENDSGEMTMLARHLQKQRKKAGQGYCI